MPMQPLKHSESIPDTAVAQLCYSHWQCRTLDACLPFHTILKSPITTENTIANEVFQKSIRSLMIKRATAFDLYHYKPITAA
ncbi:hypothetical protein NPIL_393161 [Nephila pilipes]|uniref:Uncharacterized protein n=1 Tax=Nephila pilipes TaxID=299642 RepID=A0A8X6Q4C8_NEPPI|nr:hypothetical protein NPIL_393161 [Nephila pilipes]